jgi:hypothetical protein
MLQMDPRNILCEIVLKKRAKDKCSAKVKN